MPARYARSTNQPGLRCANIFFTVQSGSERVARAADSKCYLVCQVIHRVVEKGGNICLRILAYLINNDKQC
jgi:hypothetical protein